MFSKDKNKNETRFSFNLEIKNKYKLKEINSSCVVPAFNVYINDEALLKLFSFAKNIKEMITFNNSLLKGMSKNNPKKSKQNTRYVIKKVKLSSVEINLFIINLSTLSKKIDKTSLKVFLTMLENLKYVYFKFSNFYIDVG